MSPNMSSQEREEQLQACAALVQRLALLNRESSFVEPPSAMKAPHLLPVPLEPVRRSRAIVPLAFLRTIERVEINETRVRDGVTYYVLDVYLYHFNTRLPTILNNPRHAALSTSPVKATKPDYQVERRFSEFRQLRAQVYKLVCMNPRFRCRHCSEFVAYVRFNPSQPNARVKIATGTERRKTILSKFINDFLEMAQSKVKQSRKCVANDHIPHLVKAFVRDYESEPPTSMRFACP